jgi:hypothetical protein
MGSILRKVDCTVTYNRVNTPCIIVFSIKSKDQTKIHLNYKNKHAKS